MNPFLILLLLTSPLLSPSVLAASKHCRSDINARQLQVTHEGWELHSDHGTIKVYNREVHGGGSREVLALTVINLPALKLFDTISDYAHHKDFMPYVKKSKVIPSSDDHQIRVYQKLDFPWPISSRYYTIELTSDNTNAHLAHYAISWTLSQDKLPAEKGIQLEVNDGYWQFCTVAKNKTFVEYYIHTDPGGILPQWAVNQANTRAVPEVIRALQERAASGMPAP